MSLTSSAISIPGGAGPNEDHFMVSDSWALVLDGVTRYPDDGCVHDVPWYVARLGDGIAAHIENRDLDLRAVLKLAIAAVSDRHRDTCDLENPVSPGATVAIARVAEDRVEWLVLGDSAVAWRSSDGKVRARSDERLSQLVDPPRSEEVGGILRYPIGYIAQVRNRPGGFWVASSDPGAADTAFSGTVDAAEVQELLLCTDGLTRLVERFGYEWDELFSIAEGDGASALTTLVRAEEIKAARLGSKAHDDATGVYLRFGRV